MRSRNYDLSALQLEIVMHLANGMRIDEIANNMDRSRSYVAKLADSARFKTNAKTLAHLVSIVIASGQLEWRNGGRELQSEKPKSLVDRLSEMSDG